MHRTTCFAALLGSALLQLGAVACSGPDESVASPVDGGSDGARSSIHPPLPKECDETLPETVISHDAIFSAAFYPGRLRAVGDTLYLQLPDGIHRTTVPNGSDELVFPVVVIPRDGGRPFGGPLNDYWIDATSFKGVLIETVFAAPPSGGPLVMVSGKQPSPWTSASQIGYDSGFYTRHGDDVYHSIRAELEPGLPKRGIRKVPLSGAEPFEFLPLNTIDASPIAVAGDFLYYVAGEAHGEEALFRSPFDAPRPEKLGELPGGMIVGVDGASIYVATQSPAYGKLWRVNADGRRDEMKLPEGVYASNALDSRIARIIQGTMFDGALYLVMKGLYQLPDDRRNTWRYLITRVRNDSDKVELVRCLPEPIQPTIPRDNLWLEVGDITSAENGVYVATLHINQPSLKGEAHIYRVTP